MARLRRPRDGAGRERVDPPPRTHQVPRNLLVEPRRVLRDPRCGAQRAPAVAPTAMAALDRSSSSARCTRARRARRRGSHSSSRRSSRPRSWRSASRSCTTTTSTPTTGNSSRAAFRERIYPVLTPLAVDPAHPFPYVEQRVAQSRGGRPRHRQRRGALRAGQGAATAPPLRRARRRRRFVPVEQVIAAHLDALFPGMDDRVAQRVPRHPRRRDRTLGRLRGPARGHRVRAAARHQAVERPCASRSTPTRHRQWCSCCCRELELGPDDLYLIDGMLDLTSLSAICDLDRPDLKYPPYRQQTPPEFERLGGSISSSSATTTCSCTTPTTRSTTTVERSSEAPRPIPSVLAIKQTLYRTGGEEADIVGVARQGRARRQAGGGARRAHGSGRRAGKHRLVPACWRGGRARGVRHRRIEDPRQDPARGAAVSATGMRRYCHVGHRQLQPEDRADRTRTSACSRSTTELGDDVAELFNILTGYSRPRRLPAPARSRRMRCAAACSNASPRQARPGGRIVMKMNALVDTEMIEALYAANDAGAEIDLIVPRHVLPAAGCAGHVRAHPRALAARPFPRAFADLPLR